MDKGLAWLAVAAALALAGCASGPRGGRDGAPSAVPSGLDRVPDAEPRVEPVRSSGGTSKPYTVLGRAYTPITDDRPFRESGLASWYGTGFHAQSTASGEPYDMYAMTAAHKTLPLPSYVRVRNPANGREVIVRVNDRGPFHDGRIIDLSYTAALRLDLLRGVAPVEIERITNEDIRTGAWRSEGDTRLAAAPAPMAAPRNDVVTVPAAWATPVAARPGDRVPMATRPAGTLLAQATPLPTETDAGAPTASDAAPPPRFRGMEVTDLPSLTPAAPPAPAGAASASPGLPAPSVAAPAAGFWVQLGAFREREGADGLQAQAGRALPALATQLRVFSENGTHRLQAGPFASREAANDTATQLRNGLRLAPIVVERR
ncbi:MAG: septal ring lytic transglycosylase RlpA family protein [Variovorax paradoxus]|uniref:Endolytic peptidoglycan transglycosylase RlpA n=1 Tax=Variovorax paradoxus TaxID=34073 RepID=A0A2W5QBX9_VARPD|nr:MAG: septal ring lytic transglycosylase RlpA family protein [Variovorax paradoxus]